MDKKLQDALGDAARATRLRLGLTQAQVAKKVRLKAGVYGRVERGAMMPSVPTLRCICETLGISSDALLSLGAQAPKRRHQPLRPMPVGTRTPGAEPYHPHHAGVATREVGTLARVAGSGRHHL